MRERLVEGRLRRQVARSGGLLLKWVSPGSAGVPDRIKLLPVPEEHREIVGRYIGFVEVKAPGESLDPLQWYWARKLSDLGYRVELEDGRV